MSEELAPYQQQTALQSRDTELSVSDIVAKVSKVKEIQKAVMTDGTHYGIIPGTKKPSLLKPGAEILNLTFRLTPRYAGEREPIDLGSGHREYILRCDLFHIHTGAFYGSGVGSCSTMESKYRYRPGPVEFTGQPVPNGYWNTRKTDPAKAQALLGPGCSVRKNPDNGSWEIVTQGETIENPNLADCYNTVLKMAAKRAYVDATLKATCASEVFTQDTEEMAENEKARTAAEGGQTASMAQADNADQPPPAQTAEPSGKISEAQRKRFFAIWTKSGFTKEQAESLVKACGYEHSGDILKKHYEKLCECVESGLPKDTDVMAVFLEKWSKEN
jgi:hypothetical protein